jgi:hypothetical protein
LLGLVLAIVLGWGGAVMLPSPASADEGLLNLSLTGSAEDEAILGVNLDPVLDVVGNVSGDAIVGADADEVSVDAGADAEAGASGLGDLGGVGDVGGLVDGIGGLELVDDVVDTAVDLVEPVVDPLVDACANVPALGVTAEVGDECGGGNGLLDPVVEPVESLTGDLVQVCATAPAVVTEAGEDCDNSGDPTSSGLLGSVVGGVTGASAEADVDAAAEADASADAEADAAVDATDILAPVTGLLGGGGDLGLGDLDATVDSVVETLDPIVDPLIDACASVPSLDVTVEIGDECGGGDGALDPVLDLVDPILDPIADVCLTAGVDVEVGTDCDGSGDNGSGDLGGLLEPVTDLLGGDGTGDLLGPLTGILGEGDTGELLEPVTGLLGGDGGNLGIGDLDETVDTVVDVADPILDPLLDACVGILPLDVTVEIGETCGGGDGILDPVLELVDPILDPIIDVCLSAGVDAEVGSDCDGSGDDNGGLLPELPLLPDLLGDDLLDLDELGETVQEAIDPLDLCLAIDPLNLDQELGAGCAQEPAQCTLLNINCLLPEITDPILGPGGLLEPLIDLCLGYDPLGLNLDIGSSCIAATPPTCPPDCGPTCPPDCEPTCPPFCEPTCPPFCEPTCPPFCEPTCPPFCEPTCPPFCVPTCPPFCVPTCPPFCGPPTCTVAPCGPTVDIDGDIDVDTDGATGAAAGAGGRGNAFVPVSFQVGDPVTTGPLPPAAPLDSTGAFVPPVAGSGGLLGMQDQDSGATSGPGTLLLVLLVGIGLAGRCIRKVS